MQTTRPFLREVAHWAHLDRDFQAIYLDRVADAHPMLRDGRIVALWGGGIGPAKGEQTDYDCFPFTMYYDYVRFYTQPK